jgi:hypothetical protein
VTAWFPLVYEFRIHQFDLTKPDETNAARRLFNGVENNVTASMLRRLCFETTGGFRHVYCVKPLLEVLSN